MNQTTIFDMLYDKYKITKPIRLIEFFAGYGSQALALKYLGVEFEHWKTCEWAVKSIQAYKDIHFTNEHIEINMSKEEMINYLYEKGISSNYNEPMTREQISRLNEDKLKTIIENIKINHNLVNIQQVKGEDLEIVDKDKYEYILTYSFPCQDLSLAGKGKGMSDTSTRSGMLWEVERILTECKERPQILLMENVPQVHGADNLEDFNKWKTRLEELGYSNYFQDLIATDYGIPQTRNRCFMISILGNYNYIFPKPMPLKLKLKDMLEDNVDESYYLSDKYTKEININKDTENYVEWDRINGELEHLSRAYKKNKSVCTLHTKANEIKIIDNQDTFNKSLKETLQKNNIEKDISFIDSYNKKIRTDDLSGTITTGINFRNNTFLVEKRSNLRIRKLTPKECFRLMGVKDSDYENCAKNQSNASLYHLAGDSIVVNVLMAIFKELF